MKLFQRGGDSLELLLDAVCNMFGGIMFLALLVVLLAGTDPLPRGVSGASVPTAEDPAAPALRVAALRERLEMTRTLAAAAAGEEDAGPAEAAAVAACGAAAARVETLKETLRRRRALLREAEETARAGNAFAAKSPEERRALPERLENEIASLRRAVAELPARPWVAAPPERTGLTPWRLVLWRGKLYPAGDNRMIRRGGTDAVAAEYLNRGGEEYWVLHLREERGVSPEDFDWKAWAAAAPREKHFAELLCSPRDIAGSAAVRETLRGLGYRQSWRVRPAGALALTARERAEYEVSR